MPNNEGIRECDSLAGDPSDPQKLAEGLNLDEQELDPELFDRALDACIAAVEDDPADARQNFQLARLFWSAGDEEHVDEYVSIAANEKYPAALYLKAEMMLNRSTDNNSFVDAYKMFQESGKLGHKMAVAMTRELNPTGADIYKEIPPPMAEDMKKIYTRSFCTEGICLDQLGAYIESCFQASADEHDCEIIVRHDCEPQYSGLFSGIMRMKCVNTLRNWNQDVDFVRFKNDEGSWKYVKEL